MSQSMLAAGVGIALSEGMLEDNKNKNLWMASYGICVSAGYILPYSRLNENEADEIGLLYAAESGYDPSAGITFLEKMEKKSAGTKNVPKWLSTHPTNHDRIENIRAILPKAINIYEQMKKQTTCYLR